MRTAKNHARRLKMRIMLVLGVFVFSFGAIFSRAFYLQVVRSGDLEERALLQHEKTVTVPSKRGSIFDRNLDELAVSIEVDSVFAQPRTIEDSYRVTHALATVLPMDREDLTKRINAKRQFVWIKRQVDLTSPQREAVKGLKGIGMVKENRRFYPTSLAVNLIGFAGVDSNGLEGVELNYDERLKGEPFTLKAERDARGRLLLFEDIRGNVEGMDVVLTIDKTVQYIAEKALKKAVDSYGAKGGTAVVMDPSTGELLAMASFPTYDPNNPGGSGPEARRNRAVTDMFEPGSTIKAFLLSASMEEGIVSPEELFYCGNGRYEVKDRVFHDVKRYGWLSVRDVIKHSSNIGAAKIGEKLGKRNLYSYLKLFGFGEKTGVDLPGEADGMLPHYSHWSGVSVDTISFGQGVSITTLQLANALSSIANGGFLMKPHVVRYIRNHEGNTVEDFYPAILRRVISKGTARKVTEILTEVTGKGGTGELASLGVGFDVAGKTGTAQKANPAGGGYEPGKYVATFMGFVPAQNPRLTIVVTVDEPKKEYSGGVISAPVFREIAEESLAYLGVFNNGNAPDNPNNPDNNGRGKMIQEAKFSKDNPAALNADTEDMQPDRGAGPEVSPDFRGMTIRSALKFAGAKGLRVDVRGSGRAIAQTPLPGALMPREGNIQVVFR
ncbi:MAG: PASTA domain-containing protein [Deltaproteobacteria bacterium]|nr:PASTA domain-containing protein [Deltaproteobacteria bacterium]